LPGALLRKGLEGQSQIRVADLLLEFATQTQELVYGGTSGKPGFRRSRKCAQRRKLTAKPNKIDANQGLKYNGLFQNDTRKLA
jgi:hypothetical protein